jgi:GNAT superfamily N-acetyltransferase
MEKTIQEQEVASKYFRLFIEKDGITVGRAYLYVIENENRPGQKYGILGEVMVDEELRGQGIGTDLVKAVIEKAKDIGCYKLLADSRFEREKVHGWYEKLGFTKHGYGFRMDFE